MQDDIVVKCPKCKKDRHLKTHGDYKYKETDSEPTDRYTFGSCAGCGMPFVVQQTDYGHGFDEVESVVVYPEDGGLLQFALPAVVRTSYDAARGCHVAKQWIAAAVMVGRTIEAVCHDQLGSKTMISAGLKALRG